MKPHSEQSYYELLDVEPLATGEQIDAAFKRALAFYGPESIAVYSLVPEEEAAALVARLEDAYLVLSDPAERKAYDLAQGFAPPGEAPAQEGPSTSERMAMAWLGSSPYDDEDEEEPPSPATMEPLLPSPPAAPRPVAAPAPSILLVEPEGALAVTAILAEAQAPAAAPVPDEVKADLAPLSGLADFTPKQIVLSGAQTGEPTVSQVAVGELIPSAAALPEPASAAAVIEPAVAVPAPEIPAVIPQPVAPAVEPAPEPARLSAPVQEMADPLAAAPLAAGPAPDSSEPAVAVVPASGAKVSTPAPRPRAEGERREPASKPPARGIDLPPNTVFTGEVLRRVREAKGMSPRELADRTKIALTHIENIEADHYSAMPATVYLRGFLMSLARELRLDPLKVSKSYLEAAAKVTQKG